jgi:hypothetical protein
VRRLAAIALLCALAGAAAGAAADASDAGRGADDDHAHVLFDAGRDAPSAFRHYTASWRKGSDLVPVARPVERNGRRFLEIRYTGERGMACSTIRFEALPPPRPGKEYAGLALVIDCDREDFPRIGVQPNFSDKTSLSKALVLDKGLHTYDITRGFRRAKFPPKWNLLKYIMITNTAGRNAPDTSFRLGRIAMLERDAAPRDSSPPAEELFGRPVLLPQPKTCEWTGGEPFAARGKHTLYLASDASARTARTAELFADTYYGYTGRRLPVARFGDVLPKTGIVLRIDPAARPEGKAERLRPEGYHLAVEKNRVVITGADEPALYYGTVTFFQLLRSPMRITADLEVPCVRITDRPDTPNRLVRLEHPHHFRNNALGDNRGIAYLMDWTDRFVAGTKSNVLFIDFSALVRYERRPEFNGVERIYSLDDLRRFGAFCRDRFIDLCPAWQVGGHATWWLTVGYHPELREKGWRSQADVTHPDHDPIVLDCMLDVIEALQPKYASPKSDEWWHSRRDGETPDERLRGKTRAQAFLDLHVRLHRWLQARGIRMMVYHDMLTPYHNGRRFGLYRIIDEFPKDTIINLWSAGEAARDIAYFTGHGFTVWTNATGFFTLPPDLEAQVGGIGKGLYSFGNYRHGLLDEDSDLASMAYVLRTADYAWTHARRGPWSTGYLTAVRHMMAVEPNPHAGPKAVPIAMGAARTHSFAALLQAAGAKAVPEPPRGAQEIGFVPMRLADEGKKDCLALGKGAEPVTLPVGRRAASLVFLHTARINNPDDPAIAGARNRTWLYGWPCGHYVVHYADGKTATLKARLTMNVKRFDTDAANRATNENRYVWSLRGGDGGPVHLFQWEWVNPRPEAPIERITVHPPRELDVTLVLLAASAREVREP